MLGEYERILVAIDGSDQAKGAFEKAVAVAHRTNGELFIAHVIELVKEYKTLDPKTMDYETIEAQNMLAEYEDYAREQGLQKVHTLLRKGSSRDVITEMIPKEENIDVTIVGATGKGTIEQTYFGSVSADVVFHGATDVLITRDNPD